MEQVSLFRMGDRVILAPGARSPVGLNVRVGEVMSVYSTNTIHSSEVARVFFRQFSDDGAYGTELYMAEHLKLISRKVPRR